MKHSLILFITLSLFAIANNVQAQSYPSLILTGNQTYIIENAEHILNGFEIGENSTLTIKDAHVTLLESSYIAIGYSKLITENSTLEWQGQGGLRMKDNSLSEITNSTI